MPRPVPAAVAEIPFVQLLDNPSPPEVKLSFDTPPEPPVYREADAPEVYSLIDPELANLDQRLSVPDLPEPLVFVPLTHARTAAASIESSLFDVQKLLPEDLRPPAARLSPTEIGQLVSKKESSSEVREEPSDTLSIAPPEIAPDSAQRPVATAAADTTGDGGTGTAESVGLRGFVSEPLVVVRDGYGWIFTGMSPDNGGIIFTSRDSDSGKTIFTFDTLQSGEYDLVFQKQDNIAGTAVSEVLKTTIGGMEAPETVLPGQTEEAIEVLAERGAPPDFLELFAEGAYGQMTRGLIEFLETAEEMRGLLPDMYAGFLDAGETGAAAKTIERYLELGSYGYGDDRYYYELAQLYESEPLRSEKTAHRYYKIVVDVYPASIYYERALSRAAYLERHFLRVR